MCAAEFPPDDAVISYDWVKKYFGIEKVMELNEKSGRKRRRKRTRPILSEEEEEKETFLKRKPTAPVKPPVSKKACVDSLDVTDVVVLDSSQTVKKETEEEETEEALKQLLKELDEMKEQHYVCPIHYRAVDTFRNHGDEYCRCTADKCVLFCSKEEAPLYFDALNRQLHADYRDENRLPRCFCHQYPALKVSKSDKNHGRLYMNFAQPKRCDFFQWADSPLTHKNKTWMGWAPDMKPLTEWDPDVDGEGPLYTCPICN